MYRFTHPVKGRSGRAWRLLEVSFVLVISGPNREAQLGQISPSVKNNTSTMCTATQNRAWGHPSA
uniref:Uncharacterized protein n=1 Tax=Anguilla anguilla TaxID=7936 RepID=A0A0E9S5W8_ANGAN